MIRVLAIGDKCCCVHVARSDEDGWNIPDPDPRCMDDHERKEEVSYPFVELDLPEAVRGIKKRLYPSLDSEAATRKIAQEMGVSTRTVHSWLSGEKGMNFTHARKMRELGRQVNIAITTDSMLRHGSGSAPRRKK